MFVTSVAAPFALVFGLTACQSDQTYVPMTAAIPTSTLDQATVLPINAARQQEDRANRPPPLVPPLFTGGSQSIVLAPLQTRFVTDQRGAVTPDGRTDDDGQATFRALRGGTRLGGAGPVEAAHAHAEGDQHEPAAEPLRRPFRPHEDARQAARDGVQQAQDLARAHGHEQPSRGHRRAELGRRAHGGRGRLVGRLAAGGQHGELVVLGTAADGDAVKRASHGSLGRVVAGGNVSTRPARVMPPDGDKKMAAAEKG